ncbi:MAG: DNA-processing protein DprA [Candidatus Cloacimonetes bacterium]|nr:DNA-processing protein DprA [Candidatus Cloacimonadota bacterium]
MDENKNVIILLNTGKDDGTVKLTNQQNYYLNKALQKAGLFHIDLYEENVLSELDLNGLRNAPAVKTKIRSLISQRADIAWKMEQWEQSGIYILTLLDENYPQNLLNKLADKAPAVIYGLGNKQNLTDAGIAIVGSRDIDDEIVEKTQQIARQLVENGANIISGGAQGVDLTAMQAALEHGGNVIGFLKQTFSFKNLSQSGWNRFLEDGNLTLLTEIAPDEKQDRKMIIASAMNRNKYLYALAEYGIIIASDVKGGTWQGAEEQLLKFGNNIFVVDHEMNDKKGNKKLITELGALPLPDINENLLESMTDNYNAWLKNKDNKIHRDTQIEISFD